MIPNSSPTSRLTPYDNPSQRLYNPTMGLSYYLKAPSSSSNTPAITLNESEPVSPFTMPVYPVKERHRPQLYLDTSSGRPSQECQRSSLRPDAPSFTPGASATQSTSERHPTLPLNAWSPQLLTPLPPKAPMDAPRREHDWRSFENHFWAHAHSPTQAFIISLLDDIDASIHHAPLSPPPSPPHLPPWYEVDEVYFTASRHPRLDDGFVLPVPTRYPAKSFAPDANDGQYTVSVASSSPSPDAVAPLQTQ